MNIFILSTDPHRCAKYHCDRHVVKMILESAQMLCTAHHELGSNIDNKILYRSAFKNHPCAVWVRKSSANYEWLYQLFRNLCKEYYHRYNKIHKTAKRLYFPLSQHPLEIPKGSRTSFALAMPDEYKTDCPVRSYRLYYQYEKVYDRGGAKMLLYTYRSPPKWLEIPY